MDKIERRIGQPRYAKGISGPKWQVGDQMLCESPLKMARKEVEGMPQRSLAEDLRLRREMKE